MWRKSVTCLWDQNLDKEIYNFLNFFVIDDYPTINIWDSWSFLGVNKQDLEKREKSFVEDMNFDENLWNKLRKKFYKNEIWRRKKPEF